MRHARQDKTGNNNMEKREKMNKQGIQLLGENGINLVIVVLCILVLVFLAYKLYSNSGNGDFQKAENTINTFYDKLKLFKDSEIDLMKMLAFPPENWYMKSYNIIEEGHPGQECVGLYKTCLCICEKIGCSANNDAKSGEVCKDVQCNGRKVCHGIDFGVEIVTEPYQYFSGGKTFLIEHAVKLIKTDNFIYAKNEARLSGEKADIVIYPCAREFGGRDYREGREVYPGFCEEAESNYNLLKK